MQHGARRHVVRAPRADRVVERGGVDRLARVRLRVGLRVRLRLRLRLRLRVRVRVSPNPNPNPNPNQLGTYGNDVAKAYAVAALDLLRLNNAQAYKHIVDKGGMQMLEGLKQYGVDSCRDRVRAGR